MVREANARDAEAHRLLLVEAGVRVLDRDRVPAVEAAGRREVDLAARRVLADLHAQRRERVGAGGLEDDHGRGERRAAVRLEQRVAAEDRRQRAPLVERHPLVQVERERLEALADAPALPGAAEHGELHAVEAGLAELTVLDEADADEVGLLLGRRETE